jgi:hypothetical protein
MDSDSRDSRHTSARLLAFYLPQFHPIPENDEWWGRGFTEWTNVAKATPLFRGHWQPRLPADLGYYDLRVPEARELQASMARAAGVEGFCYWHYWFGNGRRILERPFQEVLESGRPDFPFCLAWANQSWSGIWHGSPRHILIRQEYPGSADERAHFEAVLPAFRDRRYITIDGKPLFAIFDVHDHRDVGGFVKHWRKLAAHAGLPGIYFVAIVHRQHDSRLVSSLAMFDAISECGPRDFLQSSFLNSWTQKLRRVRHGDFGNKINTLMRTRFLGPQRFQYRDLVRTAFSSRLAESSNYIPTVLPGWDNTPRSGRRGLVFEGSTPALFHDYLRKAIRSVSSKPPVERIVFLKAWNEWAEGNYLEPDSRFGHQYLDATRRALRDQLPNNATMLSQRL